MDSMTEETRRTSWKSLIGVVLTAFLVVVVVDIVCRGLAPVHPLREVEDAVADLRHRDPTILVMGSSHARTFSVLGEELQRRTQGRQEVLAVPVEYGKLGSYEWVLQHRLRPLLEAVNRDGKPRRSRLRHFILVTEWWDSTSVEGGGPAYNLPARAWGLADFLWDVGQNGLTPYNRNYLRNRWMRLFGGSTLMQDRGHRRIQSNLHHMVRPTPQHVIERRYQKELQTWRAKVERGAQIMGAPEHMAAYCRMLDYFLQRQIQVTVVLYPRMPGTLSPTGSRVTIDAFTDLLQQACGDQPIRLIDMTYTSPLEDRDFAEDFDHVKGGGNRKFTAWALDGPLKFLLQETVSLADRASDRGRAQ